MSAAPSTAWAEPFAAVDRYLRSELEARALSFALQCGWIDRLSAGSLPFAALADAAAIDPRSRPLLLAILTAAGIVEGDAGSVRLTSAFSNALRFRDLLEAKLWFAHLAGRDVHELFGPLLSDVPQFMARAKVFELFRYDRAMVVTADNLAATNDWVRYTTALTRYEAAALLALLDLGGRGRMLDVGGNSGELAVQTAARWPGLAVDVFDLPVVCELGRRNVAGRTGADRVHFIPGDLRRDALPAGYDVVAFKSVLHDWPDEHARMFLAKAASSLKPGGELLIFERVTIDGTSAPLPYSMVANLVFLPFFRPAAIYRDWLAALGLGQIRESTVRLEMPFHFISARKPS